jgi:TorA maturation chaperone TorD
MGDLQSGDLTSSDEVLRLRETAGLLARLLLHEIDAGFLRGLKDQELTSELAGLGLELPDEQDPEALDRLAAAYFEAFVNPAQFPPPVQSLVAEGTYEGEAARSMRAIAEAVGVTFDATAARGAPVDHLGSQLLLWSELLGRDQGAAAEFATRHLAWSIPYLRQRTGEGFYDRVSGIVADFIEVIVA